MSRVQCLDCGGPVVVDPAGHCPEGHLVGAAGARIAQAIGADVPHPDEPEPWVATVVLDDDEPTDGTGPASSASTGSPAAPRPLEPPRPRTPTPPRAPAPPAAPAATYDPVEDSEEFLRELHALSELSGDTAAPRATSPTPPAPSHAPVDPSRPGASPAPATPTTSTPGGAPSTAPTEPPAPSPASPRPSSDEIAEGLAEFSALEAAVQALDTHGIGNATVTDQPLVTTAPAEPAEATPEREDTVEELEELFAAVTSAPRPGSAPAAAPAHGPTDGPTPGFETPASHDPQVPGSEHPGLDPSDGPVGTDGAPAARRHLQLAPAVPSSPSVPDRVELAGPTPEEVASAVPAIAPLAPVDATAEHAEGAELADRPDPVEGPGPDHGAASEDVTAPAPGAGPGPFGAPPALAPVPSPPHAPADPGPTSAADTGSGQPASADLDPAPELDLANFAARGPRGAGRRAGKRGLLRR